MIDRHDVTGVILAGGRGSRIGGKAEGCLPWTVVPGVDDGAANEPLFRDESFAPVIAETAVSRLTERGATRADDRISEAGMEDRKREGYF